MNHNYMSPALSINDIIAKKNQEKIVQITSYDYTFTKILDQTKEIDVFLIGDSLGMVVQGHPTPIGVTLDQMLYHTEMVSRAVNHGVVVADMPFMTYQVTMEDAIYNAGRLIQEGKANAVKLEGAGRNVETIETLVEIGIPVQGHLGLTPQSYNKLGWKVQAKTKSAVERLVDDALALEAAGIFSLVLEAIPNDAAKLVSEAIEVPTIGIGAGPYCDGQVLVLHDILGLGDYARVFVKEYANFKDQLIEIAKNYSGDVKSEEFPGTQYSYKSKIEE